MSNNLNHLRVFIKKILSVIFLCLVLTACTDPKQSQPPTIKITPSAQPEPTKENTVIKPEKENIIPVEYMPLTLPTISLSPIGTNVVNKKLKEVKLQDASVVLYSKKSGESHHIYAGIKTGDKIFEIDGIIGYGNPDETEISQNYFNGISLIKIRGSEGASAPITHYIKIENGFPISFIQMEKYCQEYDIDSDGKKELITSAGGTIPETEIIKVNGNKFESVNLNQVMNGVVTFDNKQLEFIVYQPNKNPELYKMTSRGMEYVSEQSIATIDNKNTTINEPQQKVWFPRPHGGRTISASGNLLDDTFIDPNNGWALFHIGEENRWELQRTFDGGKNWDTITNKAPEKSLQLSILDDKHGWLLGNFEKDEPPILYIMRTEDGGVTWKKQTLESPVDTNKITKDTEIISQNMFFFNESEGIVQLEFQVMDSKSLYIYYTSDKGSTWSKPVKVDLTKTTITFGDWTWVRTDGNKLIFSKGNKQWISDNNGETWNLVQK